MFKHLDLSEHDRLLAADALISIRASKLIPAMIKYLRAESTNRMDLSDEKACLDLIRDMRANEQLLVRLGEMADSFGEVENYNGD